MRIVFTYHEYKVTMKFYDTRLVIKSTLLLALSLFVISACHAASDTGSTPKVSVIKIVPTAQEPVTKTGPHPQETRANSFQPTLEAPTVTTSVPQQVLDACEIESQTAAMRPDQVPDWSKIGLSTCYDLTLDLDIKENSFQGSAKITFTNLTGVELADLVLRTYPNANLIYDGTLTLTSAIVDGSQVKPQVFLSDNTAVRLPLNAHLSVGETAVIDLEFTGRYTFNFGDQFGVYGIFNYVNEEQVLTLANWYPLLAPWIEGSWDVDSVIGIGDAVVSQTSLYKVRLTAPSTGSIVSLEEVDDHNQWEFVSGPVRDFTILASPNFILREAQVGDVYIRHWGLSDGEARWDEALQATIDSLTLFNERYGPYPYRELDAVAVPLTLAAGVEYPGIFLIDDSQYEIDEQSPFLLAIVVSHEVAHQWWYGVVGNDVLRDPWQDEALATFSSLFYQQEYQTRFYEGTVRFYQERVSDVEQQSKDTAIDQPLRAFIDRPGEYSPIVYTKGALFFVELREMLGDQIFFNALQAYYSLNKYQIATPEELLDAFETACECELDNFYTEWGLIE